MQYATRDRCTLQFFFRAAWKKSYVSLRLKANLWQQYKDCWKISVSTYKIWVNDKIKKRTNYCFKISSLYDALLIISRISKSIN